MADDFDWGDDEGVLFSRKASGFETKATTFDPENRTVDVVMTTPMKDRDDEIIQPKAFEETIDAFKDNPVVLFNHKAFDEPPIGTVIPDSINITPKEMTGTVQFRPKGRSALADKVADAVEDQVLTKVSIGFKVRGIEEKADGERTVIVITKADLVELSIVSVPSNPEARIKSTTMGRLQSHLDLIERAAFTSNEETKKTNAVFYRPSDIDVLLRTKEICARMLDSYAAEKFIDERELKAVLAVKEVMIGFKALTEEAIETGEGDLGDLKSEFSEACAAIADL
jgi:HK97 family phage prohead protease